MPKVRPPAVAGQFYPAPKKSLKEKIEQSFKHRLGPGRIPELGSGGNEIKGAVAPHAGYKFSGPVAAHVYGAIAEGGYPDTFIILGPKHPDPFGSGSNPAVAVTKENFEMPFGEVQVDQELADEIVGGSIEISSDMHASEHSIEVHLPFLQYFKSDLEFVPICISSQNLQTAEEVGESIRDAIMDRSVTIIASTDFSHTGPRYGQTPPEGKSAGEFAAEQDKKAIQKITDLDAEGLSKVVDRRDITMCGPAGVEAMILVIKDEVDSGDLLKYSTSQDVMSGKDAVGYGGIVFK